MPHFDSKYEVEEHIAKIGVRATVLAPVYFMVNLHFGKEQLAKGIYATDFFDSIGPSADRT